MVKRIRRGATTEGFYMVKMVREEITDLLMANEVMMGQEYVYVGRGKVLL